MQGVHTKYDFDLIRKLVKEGKSIKEIAEIYNVAPSSFSRAMRKFGIKYNIQVRKIEKDHNFFETIDSEIKAYLLGFFVADGCVYNKNRIGLTLAKQDYYIINLFKNYIAPTSYIKEFLNTKGAVNRQPQLTLRISSIKIVNDLKKYGIGPRKTYTPIHIPDIEYNLQLHFIRGFMDGDGYVGVRKFKNHSLRIIFSNGDNTILKDIQKFFNFGRLTDKKTYSVLEIDNTKKAYYILTKLYNNANFYLQRKKDKFDLVNTEITNKSKKLLVS